MKLFVGVLCVGVLIIGVVVLTYSNGEGDGRETQFSLTGPPPLSFSEGPDALPKPTREATHAGQSAEVTATPLALEGRQETTVPHWEIASGKSEVQDAPQSVQRELRSPKIVEALGFENQRRQVEADLAGEKSRPREDVLPMYGRSSAASGRFDVAAAAYAIFLDEFGTEHPDSGRIAMRFADCLAPLNLDSIDIIHTEQGPEFDPQWRMGRTANPDRLRQAIAAYQLAAELAGDEEGVGRALLRTGWVYRALDDWPASTEAWDRCAARAAGTASVADALWLAAENLAWTGQPAAATQRLRRMAADYPEDARASAAAQRVEYLEAEARRSPDWLADPLGSLRAEIEARTPVRSQSEVYRSVIRWLQRRGERVALIAVSRWACSQSDWPVKAKIACRYDLVDALLLEPDNDARLEAAERLGEIVDLAPSNASAVPAAIRGHRLLNDLGRFNQADELMDEIAARVRGSRRWEPVVLTERIESLLARGDHDRARAALDTLVASHPDYCLDGRFDAAFATTNKEESK